MQEPTESGNTGPWLADNQSRDLKNEVWLVVYLCRSVAGVTFSESEVMICFWSSKITSLLFRCDSPNLSVMVTMSLCSLSFISRLVWSSCETPSENKYICRNTNFNNFDTWWYLSSTAENHSTEQRPTESSKQPIRNRYLGHVTGYKPIRDQYFQIRSVPASQHHHTISESITSSQGGEEGERRAG